MPTPKIPPPPVISIGPSHKTQQLLKVTQAKWEKLQNIKQYLNDLNLNSIQREGLQ